MDENRKLKIVVISDTHGDSQTANEVIEKELPFDYLIHCGDAQMDPESFLEHREQYGLLAVKGNCDWFVDLPEYLFRKLGSCGVLIVHGHRQGVRDGHRILLENARRLGASVVLYGHTHVPVVTHYEEPDVLVVNPGSLTENRPAGRAGTYAVMTISPGQAAKAEIMEIYSRP